MKKKKKSGILVEIIPVFNIFAFKSDPNIDTLTDVCFFNLTDIWCITYISFQPIPCLHTLNIKKWWSKTYRLKKVFTQIMSEMP